MKQQIPMPQMGLDRRKSLYLRNLTSHPSASSRPYHYWTWCRVWLVSHFALTPCVTVSQALLPWLRSCWGDPWRRRRGSKRRRRPRSTACRWWAGNRTSCPPQSAAGPSAPPWTGLHISVPASSASQRAGSGSSPPPPLCSRCLDKVLVSAASARLGPAWPGRGASPSGTPCCWNTGP